MSTRHKKCPINPSSIKGMDDCGTFYNDHAALVAFQTKYRTDCYEANKIYWNTGGYGGKTDDEVMTGDSDGIDDASRGLDFLDRLQLHPATDCVAVDVGAGVGRITKGVLLKRYQSVRLLEGNTGLSDYSRVYLGRKRSQRCHFTNCFLQDLTDATMTEEPVDLVWIQWCLQYLVDADVVECLITLAKPILTSGAMIVKENRPYGTAREDRFQMDIPTGINQRYDITRTDDHHKLLFHKAGLTVYHMEKGVETHTYALRKTVAVL